MSYEDKALAARPPEATTAPEREPAVQRERPAWLVALDGLCGQCKHAEFYGLRMKHAKCERGDCRCAYVIPDVWPAGTWPA
jgi:hypothetical protein